MPIDAVREQLEFPTAYAKAAWLEAHAHADAADPDVQKAALAICGDDYQRSPFRCAEKIFRFVRDHIRWAQDPGGNETFDASALILERGYDDCDGKARLFVALCDCAGVEAQTRPIFDQEQGFYHVQAQCRLPGSDELPFSDHGWLVVELTSFDLPLGAGAESRSKAGSV